jgi:hypothetical protein
MSETKEFNNAAEEAFASNPDVQALLRMEPGKFVEPGSAQEPQVAASQGAQGEKVSTNPQTPASAPEQASSGVQPPSSPASAAAVTPAAAPTPATTPTPAAAPTDPELEQLKAFYRGLQAAPAVSAAAPPKPQAQPELPHYAYEINEHMVRAVTSEDIMERANALKAFATNLSQTVHMRAVEQMRQEVAAAIPVFVTQMIAQEYAKREIARDFYGTFPELNRPEVAPIVAQVAQQVMTELRANDWNQRVRDTVGARVKAMLGAIAGQVQPQQQAPVMTTQAATPLQRDNNSGDDMLAFLGMR